MEQSRARYTATRSGFLFGGMIAVAGCADAALQAWGRAIGPSAHSLIVFTALFFALVVVLLVLAGLRAARASGRLRTGMAAGVIAGVLPMTAFTLVAIVQTPVLRPTPVGAEKTLDASIITTLVLLIFAAGSAIVGALLATPGALVGRRLYRRRHLSGDTIDAPDGAANVMHMAPDYETPSHVAGSSVAGSSVAVSSSVAKNDIQPARSRGKELKQWLEAILLMSSALLLPVASFAVALWIIDRTAEHAPLIGVSLLLAGAAIFLLLRHSHRLLPLRDWLALAGLALGASLIWPSAAGLFGPSAMMLYIQRAYSYVMSGFSAALREVRDLLKDEVRQRPEVIFRDDGERIVVYPTRWQLTAHATLAASIAFLSFGALLVFRFDDMRPVVALGAFGIIGLIGLVPDLMRLAPRRPALIVTSAGIEDHASLHVVGTGLIPWREIGGVYSTPGDLLHGRFAALVIITRDEEALLARQHPFKRSLLRLMSRFNFGDIHISSLLLSEAPAAVAARINAFVKTHAPPNYVEPEDGKADDESEKE